MGEAALEDALSQGRVLAGVELRLVHPETGALVPHDGRSIGELELRGPWITASYLSGQDPDKFHDGWLRTGDIGTLDPDGYVRLTDRAKDASSPAASGSPRSAWRPRSRRIPRSSRRP